MRLDGKRRGTVDAIVRDMSIIREEKPRSFLIYVLYIRIPIYP